MIDDTLGGVLDVFAQLGGADTVPDSAGGKDEYDAWSRGIGLINITSQKSFTLYIFLPHVTHMHDHHVHIHGLGHVVSHSTNM